MEKPLYPSNLVQGIAHRINLTLLLEDLKTNGPYLVKGVFRNRSAKVYGSFYYGDLDDPTQKGASLRLKVPVDLPLEEEAVYTLVLTPEGGLGKDGRVAFTFLVQEVRERGSEPPPQALPPPVRTRPRLDVRGLLLGILRKGETPSLALILGVEAIVQEDVYQALGDARGRYRMDELRVPLTDPGAVAERLKEAEGGSYDAIALVRGGGSNLELLDHPDLFAAFNACSKPLLVALGHAQDRLWLESLADLALPTPTALGHFLKEVVEERKREEEYQNLAQAVRRLQEAQEAWQREKTRLLQENGRLLAEKARLEARLAQREKAPGMGEVLRWVVLALLGALAGGLLVYLLGRG